MIVSNSTSSAPSAIQGVDFLARASKPDSKDSAPSNFSDLLDVNGPAGLGVSPLKGVQPQSRVSSSAPDKADVSDSAPAVDAGIREQAVSQGKDKTPGDALGSPVGGGLVDETPLVRDPRLEDPIELALEAAAIAIATTLVQKNQEPLAQVGVQGEPQAEAGIGQGGTSSEPEKQPLAGEPTLPGAVSSRLVTTDLGSAVFAGASLAGQATAVSTTASPRSAAFGRVPSGTSVTDQPVINVQPVVSVVPKFVPTVVVTATPAEAVAIVGLGGGESLSPLAGLGSVPQATAKVLDTEVYAPSEASLQSAPNAFEPVKEGGTVQMSDILQASLAPSVSDAEFLASAPPLNPAAAFFAERVNARGASNGLLETTANVGAVEIAAAGLFDQSGLQSKDASAGQFGGHDSGAGARHEQAAASPPVSADLPEAAPALNNESRSGFGTFGAENKDVQSERSPVLNQPEETSASVKSTAEESSSPVSVVSSQELRGTVESAGGVSSEGAHRAATRPTVLSPVHAKFNELNNVVHNALERARSENPSHLAVEVTLDDGSSFGLEVRMSTSGLQASFRSESQPLLKALESSWAGFLAKESGDQKVASAAFEGRTGFGEFSNNGSSAGEKRQQFEDGAAAALLNGLESKDTSPKKSPDELEGRPIKTDAGMALYA